MTDPAAPAPSLEFAIYVSRSNARHSIPQLQQWSKAFAEKNAPLEITGLLLTIGDHFVQILEGERSRILQLLRTIEKDARHTAFKVIYLRPAAERSFAQWAMRWVSLDEKLYLGFDEMVHLRNQVRSLVGHEDAQREDFLSLIRSVPALLMRYPLKGS